MFTVSEIEKESVFATKHCVIEQCDVRNAFYVSLFGEMLELKVCSLLIFKQRIFSINIERLLLQDYNTGIEVISFNCQNRVFVFTADEILELRNLLDGTFTMLEMNSMIQSSLRKKFF